MDQNGSVTARHDYLPFGEEVSGTAGRTTPGFGATDNVTEKFTGQVRDSETSQDFFNARYFTPALGRFNSVDPANAGASLFSSQRWNGYAYVWNNPLNAMDPTGRDITCSTDANGNFSCQDDVPPASSEGPADLIAQCWWCWEYGFSFAGAQQTAQPAQKPAPPAKIGTRTCPSVPAWPPNKPSVDANMQQSQQPQPVPGFGLVYAASATMVQLTAWFNNVCCWSSAWNFQGGDNGNANLPQFDDAGNFNFGATGVVAGVPSSALMWGGGLVKNINYWSKGKANPYSNQPYMNDPHKMTMIAQGIQYAQNGCP